MTTLPKQVVVGPFTYRVSDTRKDWKRYVSKSDRGDCWGYCGASEQASRWRTSWLGWCVGCGRRSRVEKTLV